VKPRRAQSTMMMWVIGAGARHMGSPREPCLLHTRSQMVAASDSSTVYKFGKKNTGKGQNTNTLASGPNICMKRVV
jgi:hypothetical protein